MTDLVTPAVPRHVFGDHTYEPAKPFLSRPPQTERSCLRCTVIKITAHLPDGQVRRAWRWPGETFQSPVGPKCVAEGPRS